MNQLARVAVDSWQEAAGLGALTLMQQLGIAGRHRKGGQQQSEV